MTAEEETAHVAELRAIHTKLYERKMQQPFTGSAAAMEGKLVILLHDHGFQNAKKGLEIVFTHEQCKWVKNGHVDLLLKADKWEKHILPLLNFKLSVSRGEQSEFGDRPDGEGFRRVW